MPLVALFVFAACSEDTLVETLESDAEAFTDIKSSGSSLKSSKSVELSISSVSASNQQSQNPAGNAIDGNMSTRWSGQGRAVNFIADLGSSPLIDYIGVAFFKGDQRKATFEVWVSNNGSNWTRINKKTSSGTTTSEEEFDLNNSTARYLRLKCMGTNTGTWNSILEFNVYGTPDGNNDDDDDDDTPPGNTPGAFLGLTSNNWKLNGFTGSPGSNAEYEDDVLSATGKNFNNYSDNNYFYTDGNWAYFKCYRGLGGSDNSDNPRVELREMSNGNLASWNGSGSNHSMTWTVRVDQLPRNTNNREGILCFGQIHGPSNGTDDLIRVQFLGTPDQSSGTVRMKISGYITEDVRGGSVILDRGNRLDTSYTYRLTFTNGVVRLYENNTEIFEQSTDTSTSGNYFKVGNYLQSVKGASFTGSYGLVRIKDLSITH